MMSGTALSNNRNHTQSVGPEARFYTPDQFGDILARWKDLQQHSVETNPCYAPEYVTSVCNNIKKTNHVGVLVIEDNSLAPNHNFIGLLPIASRHSLFNSVNILFAQHTDYSGCSVPLIRRGAEEIAISKMLDWFETQTHLFGLVRFCEVSLKSKLVKTLIDQLSQRKQAWTTSQHLSRPLLDISEADHFEQYLALLSSRTKQSLRRKKRRLGELGELTHTVHEGQQVLAALSEFEALESRGWKGDAGTCIGRDAFAHDLVFDALGSEEYGLTRVECLRMDGRPIAMDIYIGNEKSFLLFKPTYDERFAKYSPGSILHLETVKQLYQTRWTRQIDSAVTSTDKLSSIWRQKIQIVNLSFSTSARTPRFLVKTGTNVLEMKPNSKKFLHLCGR